MSDIVVFESANEVIVGSTTSVNKLIEDYFLDGGRNLDDYNVYLADGKEGVSITTRTLLGAVLVQSGDYDVTELMPNVLREALIKKGLLTDE